VPITSQRNCPFGDSLDVTLNVTERLGKGWSSWDFRADLQKTLKVAVTTVHLFRKWRTWCCFLKIEVSKIPQAILCILLVCVKTSVSQLQKDVVHNNIFRIVNISLSLYLCIQNRLLLPLESDWLRMWCQCMSQTMDWTADYDQEYLIIYMEVVVD